MKRGVAIRFDAFGDSKNCRLFWVVSTVIGDAERAFGKVDAAIHLFQDIGNPVDNFGTKPTCPFIVFRNLAVKPVFHVAMVLGSIEFVEYGIQVLRVQVVKVDGCIGAVHVNPNGSVIELEATYSHKAVVAG